MLDVGNVVCLVSEKQHVFPDMNGASPPPWVLHNPLAHRRNAGFPMIGKYFSNGWKIPACFSNDWKNLSPVFQRLEKFSRSHFRKTNRTKRTTKPTGNKTPSPRSAQGPAQDRPPFPVMGLSGNRLPEQIRPEGADGDIAAAFGGAGSPEDKVVAQGNADHGGDL